MHNNKGVKGKSKTETETETSKTMHLEQQLTAFSRWL